MRKDKALTQWIILFGIQLLGAQAYSQVVGTTAGVWNTPGANDGPLLSARFNNPHGIAIGPGGAVYIADRFNHTIRILKPDGQTTTLAGNPGQSGFADGKGEQALFFEPWGLCVGSDGTVFVADTRNNRIRRISPGGEVSTLAGTGRFGVTNGPAAAASFGNPTDLVQGPDGSLYVVDHLTHLIRRIRPDGQVSTLAGTPLIPGDRDGQGAQAQFWRPYGLVFDNNGHLLVADEWNHKIRRVTLGGVVSTVAGTGKVGLNDGPAASAQFNFPWDVEVDANGNIYVADGYNYLIRRISPSGTVSFYCGIPLTQGGADGPALRASFSGATSLAFSPDKEILYVADPYNHLIRQITETEVVKTPQVNLSGPASICEGEVLELSAGPASFSSYALYINNALYQRGQQPSFRLEGLAPGPYALRLDAEQDSRVLASDNLLVEVWPLPRPLLEVEGELRLESGDSTILRVKGEGSIRWSDGSLRPTLVVRSSGAFYVELSSGKGCTGRSDTVVVEVVEVPVAPTVTNLGKNRLCRGESTLLQSSASQGNQWFRDGRPLAGETNPTLQVQTAGVYQVQARDARSGRNLLSNTIEIFQLRLTALEFSASSRQILPGETVQFQAGGGRNTYEWDFGDPLGGQSSKAFEEAPAYRYDQPGRYTVRLVGISAEGCIDTLERFEYIVVSPPAELFIPNAFSPNGDGVNDYFLVRGARRSEGFLMQIFDPRRRLLFESQDINLGWDGNYRNLPLPNGTYAYCVRLTGADGAPLFLSGTISLLR